MIACMFGTREEAALDAIMNCAPMSEGTLSGLLLLVALLAPGAAICPFATDVH